MLTALEAAEAQNGDGRTELFTEWSIYGTGAIFETCVLAGLKDRLDGWMGPDFRVAGAGRRPGERWLEARPCHESCQTGPVLRVTQDSLGNPAAVDTVRWPVP